MYRNILEDQILSTTTNENAMHAFLAAFGKEGHEKLSRNKNLPLCIWKKLVTKAKIDVATNLYNRELSAEQLEIAIKDVRVYARRSLVLYGLKGASEEFVERIIAEPWLNPDLIKSWLHYGTAMNGKHRRELSLKMGGTPQIRQLAYADAYPDILEVVSILQNNRYSLNMWDLAPVFDTRPELMNHIDELKSSEYRSAFASSWNLINPEHQLQIYGQNGIEGNINAWTNLLRNPYTSIEVFEKISSQNKKKWQKDFFTLSKVWKDAPGKPLTLPLAQLVDPLDRERAEYFHKYKFTRGNLPWSESKEAEKLKMPLDEIMVNNQKSSFFRYSTDWVAIHSELDSILLTESSWQAFWSLLEKWQGSLKDLADTSAKL